MTRKLHRNEDGTLPAFAWPGGYPIYYFTEDYGILCPNCANTDGSEDSDDPQWKLTAADIHWEGEPLTCDNCSAQIESAYASRGGIL